MTDPLVWFITGTSSGFGHHLALITLARGDLVIATARSPGKITDLPRNNPRLKILELDLDWDAEKIQRCVDDAENIWGRIDVLANNAGFGFKGIMEESGSAAFRKQFQTNVFGLIDVTNAVLPGMRERRSGTIVMMGSRASWRPEVPALGVYASSKAAVRVYSEALAVEVKPFSVRILIVEPAAFKTQALVSHPLEPPGNPIPDYDDMRQKAIDRAKTIYKHLKGDPEKAMNVVADVVRGDGKAKGREWPLYLLLGIEAGKAVQEKTDLVLKIAEDWKDVTSGLDFDE